MDMEKLIAANKVELYLLKSILESEGIACFIKNEYPPAAGEVPPILVDTELWVIDNAQYDQAMKLIQENQVTPKQSSWQCANCGEWLEGQFSNCWRCGGQKQ